MGNCAHLRVWVQLNPGMGLRAIMHRCLKFSRELYCQAASLYPISDFPSVPTCALLARAQLHSACMPLPLALISTEAEVVGSGRA